MPQCSGSYIANGILRSVKESRLMSFILLGFSDHPQLQKALFIVIFIYYLLTILGNTSIILISHLEPKLHMTMYFFLSHLSFLDLCFTNSVIPQLLVNMRDRMKTITYGSSIVQLHVSLALGSMECVLLTMMSYDRFVVCRPLHYTLFMPPHLCTILASMVWLSGVTTGLVPSTLTLQLDLFIFEVPVLIKLACIDTNFNEVVLFVVSVLLLVVPVSFILFSYGYIAQAILMMKSTCGRQNAFGTCSSNLLVVIIFYGTIIFIYLQPTKSEYKDQGMFVFLFYTVLSPMLKPLIYSLRNKEFKGVVKKVLRNILCINFT